MPAIDAHSGSSVSHAFTITPNDADELPYVAHRIMVLGTATLTTLTVVFSGDTEPVTIMAEFGKEHHWKIRKVLATGTNAEVIIGMY